MVQPAKLVPIPLTDRARLRDYLAHTVCDPNAIDELRAYVDNAFERFLITLGFLPETPGRVLELGSTPYFLTVLMKRYRPAYELELANFFGKDTADAEVIYEQHIDNEKYDEHHVIHFRQFNVERQSFPFPSESLDGVLFCEILEHLTVDPVAALVEIHRVLKPGGWVLVTTPNIASYRNIVRLWRGENISDVYSGYGAYGRHNREYTQQELRKLLEQVGYRIEGIQARAFRAQHSQSLLTRILRRMPGIKCSEEHLFCLARKSGPVCRTRPAWLYRSLPPEQTELRRSRNLQNRMR